MMGVDACMFFTVQYELTQDKVNHIAFDLAEAIGSSNLWQSNWRSDYNENKHLGLLCRDVYRQDGDDIPKPENGSLVEIKLWGRYYGAGYERGDLFLYIQIAAWIERNIHHSTVFYGGDSSGICAELFNEEHRNELIRHWSMYGHQPYTMGFDAINKTERSQRPEPVKCGLSRCQLRQYGFGKNYIALSCAGCGSSWESRNGGLVFTREEKP